MISLTKSSSLVCSTLLSDRSLSLCVFLSEAKVKQEPEHETKTEEIHEFKAKITSKYETEFKTKINIDPEPENITEVVN